MRLALVALVLALPAASSAKAPAPPAAASAAALPPICGPDMKVRPGRGAEGPRLKRLGDLPAGNLTLTVLDRVGNCIAPRVVGQGYGALGRRNGR